jgi:ABC-type bacteriocin/lantibiotic exporter with double-glycine peptidase domain
MTLQRGDAADRSERYRLLDVPFFPDDTDQCGPATLASVLTFWGVPADPARVRDAVYTAKLKGSLPIDLLIAAQARGLTAEAYQGTLGSLLAELDAGRPLIAFLDLGFFVFKQGHYVVVTGYDTEREGLFAHSGTHRNLFVPYAEFLRKWDRTGRWTLRLMPRGQPMPAGWAGEQHTQEGRL